MYPEYSFYIQGGSLYLDNRQNIAGANSNNILCIPDGHVSLYEYNIDRANNYIYPFLVKGANKAGFKTLTQTDYNTKYLPGDTITSSYRMSASISRDYYTSTHTSARRRMVHGLKNIFNHYSYLSPHYQYSSSHGDKATQDINLISIPSIMYGSSIKKGSLSLKYYITGSLIGEISDYRRNGELVQIGPEGSVGSGSVAGVVLYNEGFVCLTGSWNLHPESINYDSSTPAKWINFAYGASPSNGAIVTEDSDGTFQRSTPAMPVIANTTLSASFSMEYSGTTQTQVITMLANAPYGDLNHSNNPTFIASTDINQVMTGSYQFTEQPKTIKNIVYSQFEDREPKFEKVTYISKVGIYDKDKNLIGIAKVATPVRKKEDKSYTFKLKLDI